MFEAEVEKNLFLVSLIGATIQDGSKRERRNDICLYLYKYLLLWDIPYIIRNHLISTFQYKFNYTNPFSHSWDIS